MWMLSSLFLVISFAVLAFSVVAMTEETAALNAWTELDLLAFFAIICFQFASLASFTCWGFNRRLTTSGHGASINRRSPDS